MAVDSNDVSAEEKPKPRRRWLKGCGLGCGGIVLLAVILTGGAFLYVGWPAQYMQERFSANYEKAIQEQTLSAAEEEVFFDLMVSIQRTETTVSASSYACILLDRCLRSKDAAYRGQVQTAATEMRDLLDVSPSAGIRDVMDVMAKHPELTARNWRAQQKKESGAAAQP
jgi:uncharacterized iron-regulated membrane protein